MNRAERRHRTFNIKERRRDYCHCSIWSSEQDKLIRDNNIHARVWKHPQACSGYCCGNPRRWSKGKEKLTRQERRNNDSLE